MCLLFQIGVVVGSFCFCWVLFFVVVFVLIFCSCFFLFCFVFFVCFLYFVLFFPQFVQTSGMIPVSFSCLANKLAFF